MRIIYVTANLPHGGNEAFLLPELDQLERAEHEVLVVPRSPNGDIIHGERFVRCARRERVFSSRVLRAAATVAVSSPGATIRALRRLRGGRSLAITLKNLAIIPKALWLADLARKWKADHIHCHWAGTTATMAMLASRISGVPWSLTAHRWDIVENNLLAAKTEDAAFARFISHDGLRMARSMGVASRESVRVLPMGVSLPEAAPPGARLKPVFLCPARLTEVKGHRFLIEAWRILKSRGVDAELWIAGDGELRAELMNLAGTLGLAGRVEFLGALPHHELLKMYETAAISGVVLASLDMGRGLHEGIPVALMEAMSYGVPVVATRAGGVPELVTPDTGMLVSPADATALADAIQELVLDAPLREQLGRAARRRIMRTHDVVTIVDELIGTMRAAAARA